MKGAQSAINFIGREEMPMRINHQGIHWLKQHPPTSALLYTLALLGVQPALSGAAYAQAVIPPIAYGRTVQGVLGSPGDAVLPDGRPIDRFRLVNRAPRQTYIIRAISRQFPVACSFSFVNTANQRTVLLQQAQVSAPGQQVLYGGTAPQPGTYVISVFSLNAQRPLGGYTLSLGCLDADDPDDDLDDLDVDDSCPAGVNNNGTPPTPTPGVDNSGPGSVGDDDQGGDDNGGGDDDGFDD
jgi:hypothetical protein